MYAQPGKKLLFMGGEFGQRREWSHEDSLEWHLLQYTPHRGMQRWVADLNALLRAEPALHEVDFDPAGFQWIDASDYQQSIISFLRRGRSSDDVILFVGNFTPQTHFGYEIGVPRAGAWREALNGDAERYGGSGQCNQPVVKAREKPKHGQPYSISLTIPPLAGIFLKPDL
jgi:1,4-alpha-glucan branching enzyme